jgi:hypothetical protein
LRIMRKSRDLNGRTVHVIFLQKLRNTTNYMGRQKAENTAIGIRHADHVALSMRKSWH